ncbi:hypothetical protein [Solicola sp. PLA-1-18]|uniref:hypothetical protein n=1 Tax=Solicola sp. PLA-1-18 TaxID=3380532 RepID=UPI003B7795DF
MLNTYRPGHQLLVLAGLAVAAIAFGIGSLLIFGNNLPAEQAQTASTVRSWTIWPLAGGLIIASAGWIAHRLDRTKTGR